MSKNRFVKLCCFTMMAWSSFYSAQAREWNYPEKLVSEVWQAYDCDPYDGRHIPYREAGNMSGCSFFKAKVVWVDDRVATNAKPPLVLLEIEEIFKGTVRKGPLKVVWSSHFHNFSGEGLRTPNAITDWKKETAAKPKIGEQYLMAGGSSKDGNWFEVPEEFRMTAGPEARKEMLLLMKIEEARRVDETLRVAIEKSDEAAVENALSSGARINGYKPNGWNALEVAISANSAKIVELLIRHGAAVKGTDGPWGVVSYFLEPAGRAPQILKLLMKQGADPNSSNRWNKSPLEMAAAQEAADLVKIILQYGGRINHFNDEHQTALQIAIVHAFDGIGDPERTIHLLMRKGASLKSPDGNGHTALWTAVDSAIKKEGSSTTWVKYLISHGTRTDVEDKNGQTLIDFAKNGQASEELMDLLQHKKSR